MKQIKLKLKAAEMEKLGKAAAKVHLLKRAKEEADAQLIQVVDLVVGLRGYTITEGSRFDIDAEKMRLIITPPDPNAVPDPKAVIDADKLTETPRGEPTP